MTEVKEEIGKRYKLLNPLEDLEGLKKDDFGFDADTPIFRYMLEERYLDLIRTGKNRIAHITKWEDPFEAYVVRKEMEKDSCVEFYKMLKNVYGQCWTLYGDESDVRWRANGGRGRVVRIESTIGRLCDSLKCLPVNILNSCWIGRIGYLEREAIKATLNNGDDDNGTRGLLHSSLFIKRKEFCEEHEVRILFDIPDEDIHLVEISDRLLVHPSSLFIGSVLIDPYMDNHMAEEIVRETISNNSDIKVRKSDLFEWPGFDKEMAIAQDIRTETSYPNFWKLFASGYSEMEDRALPTRHWWCRKRCDCGAYNFVITKRCARVELYIDTGNVEENNSVFKELLAHQKEINQKLNDGAIFEQLEGKRAKRIKMEKEFDMADVNQWPAAIAYMKSLMPKFIEVLDMCLQERIG